MGIHISCDFCNRVIDFGGDWRRVAGGRVACVPCQEVILSVKELEKVGANLMLVRDAMGKYGGDVDFVDNILLLHKSYTKCLQELFTLTGNEF